MPSFSIALSAEARSYKLRSAALLGHGCVLFPSLPVAFLVSFLKSLQEKACSSDTLLSHCGRQNLHPRRLRSQQGEPGLTHGLAGSQSGSSSDLHSLWLGPEWLSGR